MVEEARLFPRRIHVPWMFFDEWNNVYEDLYSKDTELQKRGYERLLLWKARQNHLPSGIDSTLELIRVQNIDLEITEQISKGEKTLYAEYDLRLMYSVSIARYLNHVSNVVQTMDDTLFEMAKNVNIPHWLVQLRHDGAHSTTLPSLPSLRMGVTFALEWLKENYWKLSASIPSLDLSIRESRFNSKGVWRYLDIWQSVRMYQMKGYSTMREVPDKKLRLTVFKTIYRKMPDPETTMWVKKAGHLHHVAGCIKKRVLRLIGGAPRNDNLIAMLLKCETFIPPVNVITNKNEELEHSDISMWISCFWKDILVPLQENFSLFPVLVHKLLIQLYEEKSKHRQLVMALWIKQLCISMLKSRKILKELYIKSSKTIIKDDIDVRMMTKEQLKLKINMKSRAFKMIERKYIHLKDGYFVLQNDKMANSCPLSDLEKAVRNPNEFTLIFLSSLIDVVRPALRKERRGLLNNLVSIFVKTSEVDVDIDCFLTDEPIHTVDEFNHEMGDKIIGLDIQSTNDVDKEIESDVDKEIESDVDKEIESDVDQDMDSDSEHDWATCPLGILPWQKGSSVILDIPSDISWKLSENSDTSVPNSDFKFKTSHISTINKSVNWPAVMKKISKSRSKSSRMSKKNRLIKKSVRNLTEELKGTSNRNLNPLYTGPKQRR